jgi:hypothetical protein
MSVAHRIVILTHSIVAAPLSTTYRAPQPANEEIVMKKRTTGAIAALIGITVLLGTAAIGCNGGAPGESGATGATGASGATGAQGAAAAPAAPSASEKSSESSTTTSSKGASGGDTTTTNKSSSEKSASN